MWKEGKTRAVLDRGEGDGEGPKSMLTYSEAAGGVMGAEGLRDSGMKLPKQEVGLCWGCLLLEP